MTVSPPSTAIVRSSTFGVEFGRPILPVKIEIVDEELHTDGCWDMAYCELAAAAFRNAAQLALDKS